MLDPNWLHTGSGSATLRPLLKIENGCVIFTTLAPSIDLASIEDRLSKHPGFAGLAEESPAKGDLVRVVVRVARGQSPVELARFAAANVIGRQSYSFLHIRQKDDGSNGVAFDPIIEGPLTYLQGWVDWRRKIVSGAAGYRIKALNAAIAHLDLLTLAISKKDLLVRALQLAKSREDLHARIKAILHCSDDDARTIREIQFQRLAFLEVRELQAKRAEHVSSIKANTSIVTHPDHKLLLDARYSLTALVETKRMAEDARAINLKNKVKGKRRARTA